MKPKKKFSILRVFLALGIIFAIFCAFLFIAFKIRDAHDERIANIRHEVHKRMVGGDIYYVPKAYYRLPNNNITSEGMYLTTYYPGNAPVIQSPKALKERGLWHKNIRISAVSLTRYSRFTPEKALPAVMEFNIATNFVGEQYGLKYYTQPKGHRLENDRDEFWVESDKEPNVSYVACSKKVMKHQTPQCYHSFYDSRFNYNVHFDKRLLPEWKTIQDNVLELMRSFESKETAQAYLTKFKTSNDPVSKINIDGQRLCIPRTFVKGSDDPNNNTVPIQTMYPNFLPLQKKAMDYWDEGIWWQNVSFLIMPPSKVQPYDKIIQNKIRRKNATLIAGEEFGLEKRGKPADTKGGALDSGDLWFEKEGEDIISIISCSKKHSDNSKPQCENVFVHQGVFVDMSFDKRLFPHWKDIKDKTTALIDSFICNPAQGEAP